MVRKGEGRESIEEEIEQEAGVDNLGTGKIDRLLSIQRVKIA